MEIPIPELQEVKICDRETVKSEPLLSENFIRSVSLVLNSIGGSINGGNYGSDIAVYGYVREAENDVASCVSYFATVP